MQSIFYYIFILDTASLPRLPLRGFSDCKKNWLALGAGGFRGYMLYIGALLLYRDSFFILHGTMKQKYCKDNCLPLRRNISGRRFLTQTFTSLHPAKCFPDSQHNFLCSRKLPFASFRIIFLAAVNIFSPNFQIFPFQPSPVRICTAEYPFAY